MLQNNLKGIQMKIILLTTILTLILSGCERTSEQKIPNVPITTDLPSAFFTKDRPANVQDLVAVKKTAKKGDDVTFLARIGGRKNASFVPEISIMYVADPALLSCEVMSEDDHCSTPEDYCCEDSEMLKMGLGVVRFLNAHGDIYPFSIDGSNGLEILKYVVVEGKVNDTNEDGNFVVDASQIWVGGKPHFGDLRAGSGE